MSAAPRDQDDLVDEKLCRARMKSLERSIEDLKQKVDWANRFIIMTLIAVIGELLFLVQGYVL